MENNDALQILFIRHAETDYNDLDGRDPSDGNLNANGVQQCIELGEKLRDLPVDGYITSSLLRAFRTAAGVCNAKNDKPLLEICPELVECGCTPGYFGCSEEFLNQFYGNTKMCEKLYGTEKYDFCCEGIEANDIRAKKVIDYIKSRFTFGERVAVFSHHGFLEHLIPTALGIETHRFDFALDNISITVVDINRNGRITLRCVNKKEL